MPLAMAKSLDAERAYVGGTLKEYVSQDMRLLIDDLPEVGPGGSGLVQ